MFFHIDHIDTCFPEYLTDHHNRKGEALIGVPVDGLTMCGDVLAGLTFEATHLDAIPDAITDAQVEAAARDCIADDLSERFDTSLDIIDDDTQRYCECPCAWFLCMWGAE